jgi:hypothetical protein
MKVTKLQETNRELFFLMKFGFCKGKGKGKRPVGRPRHRWEGGVRMDLRETGWEREGGWIRLAQNRDW